MKFASFGEYLTARSKSLAITMSQLMLASLANDMYTVAEQHRLIYSRTCIIWPSVV